MENEFEIIARKLMQIMLYDNGAVNRFEPETEKRYKPKHLKEITRCCHTFFSAHPEFVTDDDLDNMGAGELEENKEKYGIFPEYKELDKALNAYFEVM